MKKKNIILLIIAIVMFILVGSTMAYFGWSSSAVNKDQLVDVTVSGGTGSCDKLSDNGKLLYPTSTREKGRILKVTTKQQMATNAFVTWNLVVNSINNTSLTTSGLKHKSFKYELINDTTGVSYGTGNFENVTNGTSITLSTDKETLDYNKEYTFILYLWIDGTIGNNPLDMTNQPYNFDLNCNITGTDTKVIPPMAVATYVNNLYSNSSKTTISSNSITYNTAPSVSLMNDRKGSMSVGIDNGNIRYYGANPSNYVYFNCESYPNTNCELWRIIGIFDGKVKLIRNESIGSYSWDNKDKTTGADATSGKNDWSDARLMKLLNPKYESETGGSLYWNSQKGTCYNESGANASKTCDFTSTGLKSSTTDIIIENEYSLLGWNDYSVFANQIYQYEKTSGGVYSNRQKSWTGKIALMYLSDYGYAADLSKCSSNMHEYSNCVSYNWLSGQSEWTLVPKSDSPAKVYRIGSTGIIAYDYSAYNSLVIRPVLFINDTTKIISGDGSESNPYQLSVG